MWELTPLGLCILTSSASGTIVALGVSYAVAKRWQPPTQPR